MSLSTSSDDEGEDIPTVDAVWADDDDDDDETEEQEEEMEEVEEDEDEC